MAGKYSSIGHSDQVGRGDARRSALLELEGGQSFPIEGTTNIGRAPNNQIVLAARSVSREHARILFEDGDFILKDLGSANGTLLNGKRVKSERLTDRDRIEFGDLKLVFRMKTAPRASDSTDPSARYKAVLGAAAGQAASSRSGRYRARADAQRSGPAPRDFAPAATNQSRRQRALSTRLPAQRAEAPAASPQVVSGTLEQENERLRKLVKQLERALADNNIRLRNLQEELDRLRG